MTVASRSLGTSATLTHPPLQTPPPPHHPDCSAPETKFQPGLTLSTSPYPGLPFTTLQTPAAPSPGRLLPYHPSLQPKFPSFCSFKTLLCEPRPVDGSEHLPSGVPTPRLQSATSENHLPLRTLKVTISLSSGPSSLPQSLSTFPRSALSFPLKWLFHFTFVTTVQGE